MAQAIHAGFLLDAPPPPAPVAVCVIDSGVTLNPDTQGAVIDRKTAFDDGQGVGDVGDVPGYLPHGTMVALVIAAPKNGWGTVGIWPQAKIVSVRVFDTPTLHEASALLYAQAIYTCMTHTEVKVISLSISGVSGSAEERGLLERRMEFALGRGVSIVVAGGNAPGPLMYPASVPGVLAVAATSWDTGKLCGFSANGLGALAAAGCGSQAGVPLALGDGSPAWAWGTSFAAPAVAAVLAAERAYGPAMSREQAEQALRSTASPIPGPAIVNAEATFRAAGLGELVAAVDSSTPAPPEPSTPASTTSPRTTPRKPATRPHQPRIRRMSLCGRTLTVWPVPPAKGARLELRVGGSHVRWSPACDCGYRVMSTQSGCVRGTRRPGDGRYRW